MSSEEQRDQAMAKLFDYIGEYLQDQYDECVMDLMDPTILAAQKRLDVEEVPLEAYDQFMEEKWEPEFEKAVCELFEHISKRLGRNHEA